VHHGFERSSAKQWALQPPRPQPGVAITRIEPLRAYGAYAPALDPRQDGDVAALLGYLGRESTWRR
jgi:hypothetical protein